MISDFILFLINYCLLLNKNIFVIVYKNWRYSHVRSGRGCCLLASACERGRAVSSSATRRQGSPGGCTVDRACAARLCLWRPTQSCGTCNGSRPPARCPPVRCTWSEHPGRSTPPLSSGTFSCKQGRQPRIHNFYTIAAMKGPQMPLNRMEFIFREC